MMISQKKGQRVVGVPHYCLLLLARCSQVKLYSLPQARFSCNLLERKNIRQTRKDEQWLGQTMQGSSNLLFIFPCL